MERKHPLCSPFFSENPPGVVVPWSSHRNADLVWGFPSRPWFHGGYFNIFQQAPKMKRSHRSHRRCQEVAKCPCYFVLFNHHPNMEIMKSRSANQTATTNAGWWLGHPSEKYESQLGWLFPIYGKIKNVPNHQPAIKWKLYHWFFAVPHRACSTHRFHFEGQKPRT